MSWVWFFWIFVVIHGLIFQSITDAVAKKKGISRLWARSAWYLGIFAVLLMVFRPHEIPSQRADTFDDEPADVKLLWQLLHVPAIFIGFLPLFFESYSG